MVPWDSRCWHVCTIYLLCSSGIPTPVFLHDSPYRRLVPNLEDKKAGGAQYSPAVHKLPYTYLIYLLKGTLVLFLDPDYITKTKRPTFSRHLKERNPCPYHRRTLHP